MYTNMQKIFKKSFCVVCTIWNHLCRNRLEHVQVHVAGVVSYCCASANRQRNQGRCDRIPTLSSSDVTACRRELAEVREALENLAAAGSRRELDQHHASTEDVNQHDRQWPELPITSCLLYTSDAADE